MLFATPPLTSADRRVIDEIDALGVELRRWLALRLPWIGQLRRSLTAAAVRGSTHIEGYTISEDEAETLMLGGEISPDTDEATVNAVTGYRDALTYIQHAAGFDIFSWDHTLFSALHFMMTRADDHVRAGATATAACGSPAAPIDRPSTRRPRPKRFPG
jgi:hypothetical protein